MGTSTHFRMPRSLDVAHSDTHPRRLWIGRGPLFALVLILACAAAFFLAASHARQERQALASDHRPRMAAVQRELTGLQTAAAEAERLAELRSRILPALERRIELVTEDLRVAQREEEGLQQRMRVAREQLEEFGPHSDVLAVELKSLAERASSLEAENDRLTRELQRQRSEAAALDARFEELRAQWDRERALAKWRE